MSFGDTATHTSEIKVSRPLALGRQVLTRFHSS
jgi:hypothetical protein